MVTETLNKSQCRCRPLCLPPQTTAVVFPQLPHRESTSSPSAGRHCSLEGDSVPCLHTDGGCRCSSVLPEGTFPPLVLPFSVLTATVPSRGCHPAQGQRSSGVLRSRPTASFSEVITLRQAQAAEKSLRRALKQAVNELTPKSRDSETSELFFLSRPIKNII